MVEEDYIMRLIREMVRTILKLAFGIDTPSPATEIIADEETRNALDALLDMADKGHINEAENMLWDRLSPEDKESLKLALLFYDRLNEKSDEFLEAHDFSREEVEQGLRSVAARYGYDGMADVFLGNRV